MMAFRLLAGAMTLSLGMTVFPARKLFGLRIGVCDVRKILPFRAVFGAPLALSCPAGSRLHRRRRLGVRPRRWTW